ncbi:hypothetical protein ACWEKM_08830 [Streptomyces sp. NPDC004752]
MGSLYEELHPHLVNESWDVTAQLAVQFLDERLGDAANGFVSLALGKAQSVSEAKQKSALISFCARLLEFVTLRPSVARDIVSSLLRLTVELRKDRRKSDSSVALRRRQNEVVSAAWAGACMCAPEARDAVNDELMKALNSSDVAYDDLRLCISMADFVPGYASVEVRKFWAEQDRRNSLQVPLVDYAKKDIRAAGAAVLFGLVEAEQAVRWHGASVMTEQDLSPRGVGHDIENVLSELADPRIRWKYEDSGRIAGEVVNSLLRAPTPWMSGRQSFITYAPVLADGANNVACRVLSWMLGLEMESDDIGTSQDEEGGDDFTYMGAHDLLARIAKARKVGVFDPSLNRYREMFTQEFFDFIRRWCIGEFSLSTPDQDD